MDNKKADQQEAAESEALAKFSQEAAKMMAELYRTKKQTK